MKLEEFLEDAKRADVLNDRVKIPKRNVSDELQKGDEIPIDHPAVTIEIIAGDAFDIPQTWDCQVSVDVSQLDA